MTLYDSFYLYIKLASEALSEGWKRDGITDGVKMYERAKNYYTRTRKCCYFAITVRQYLFQQFSMVFYGARFRHNHPRDAVMVRVLATVSEGVCVCVCVCVCMHACVRACAVSVINVTQTGSL